MSSTGIQTPPVPGSRPFRWVGRRLAVASGIILCGAAAAVAAMEWYTGQPRFCGSCHIMQPYYESWSKDVHGTKAQAACIDCHYAPGERHTFQAKLRGLSQLVTYFSGRAGGRRPRPHVQDSSCLREGCHRTAEFLDQPYPVRDVKFVHNKHLQPDTEAIERNRRRLAASKEQLAATVEASALQRLEQLTVQLGDPNELAQAVGRILEPLGRTDLLATAADYVTFARRDIRYRQMTNNLRCTTCHAFSGGTEHFTTQTSSCFTCHFVGQPFNTDTGECLKCHNPPRIEVPIHGKPLSELVGEARKVGTMDHSLIIEQKVDCRSCHADLIKGTGQVQRTRCEACHDLPMYFTAFDRGSTPETVDALHDMHVGGLYATCVDCHEAIQHRLKPKEPLQMADGFLEPIRENCAHCHPNHHLPQVQMLTGQAPPPVPAGGANAMFGSRVNCLGCHTRSTVDAKGTAVIEATRQACVICHAQDYQVLFDQWISSLDTRHKEVQDLLVQLDEAVQRRGGLEQVPLQVRGDLAAAREAVNFVGLAKGIHNRNYALTLLDHAEAQLLAALRLLGEPAPVTPVHPPSPATPAPPTEASAADVGPSADDGSAGAHR